MFRRKVIIVASLGVSLITTAAALALWSVRATEHHLRQAELAHSLYAEHLQLSVQSYRLFKQMTDEILLGTQANQAVVRNKRAAIADSLTRIRRLELDQRAALGPEVTTGAVEDTDELESLIDAIIDEFAALATLSAGDMRAEQVRTILEDRIDISFREAVNAALARQGRLVQTMQARIDRVHGQLIGVSIALSILALLGGALASRGLVKGVSAPLEALGAAARRLGAGDMTQRVVPRFDSEFNAIAETFNTMAAQVEAEQHRRDNAARELETAVAARTRELTAANQALRESDGLRRQFFADVSHELRTPLTVIRGEAQVALRAEHRPPEEYRQALAAVLDQSIGLSRLVDDMLFIARADAQGNRLQRQSVPIRALSADILRDVRALADGRGVTLAQQEPGASESDVLFADPDRVRQLLLILLDNAVRYSPAGATVTLGWTRDEPGFWRLCVRDDGPGIDPHDLPHLFERFFRGSGHAQGASGLGLGLAVAKSIVVAHGGRIWADSRPGGGTSMWAVFPDAGRSAPKDGDV